MEQPTTCQICRRKVAKFTCKNCGANACENCYDKKLGICITCMPR